MPRINPLTADKKIQANWAKITDEYFLLMRNNHITQAQVAELLNVHKQTISRQFSSHQLKLETMLAIQQILGDKGEQS